jgi:hypothetical protein
METTRTRATKPNHRRKNSNSHVLQAGLRCVAVAGVLLGVPLAYADQLPPLQTQGKVQYVTGGIGKDEADAMKQAEAQFPLTLEFATSAEKPASDATAPFVADAIVAIRDQQGRGVLSARSDGPLLLVRLPSGNYTIEAEWNGVRKQRTIALANGKRQHVMFDFVVAEPPTN